LIVCLNGEQIEKRYYDGVSKGRINIKLQEHQRNDPNGLRITVSKYDLDDQDQDLKEYFLLDTYLPYMEQCEHLA
jgi:hypothetical protein